MKSTPILVLALLAIIAFGVYIVSNRASRTRILDGRIALSGSSVRLDPSVKSVIDDLCSKWSRVEKLSAVIHTEMPNAAGMDGTTKGIGEYAYQRSDGDPLLCLRLRNVLSISKETTLPDGRTSNMLYTEEEIVTTHDGDSMWQRISQLNNQQMFKRKYDPAEVLQLGGRDLWDTLVEGTTVTRLPDEHVEEAGGLDAHKFSVTPLDGDWTSVHWFDKETGLRLKTVETGPDKTVTLTMWVDQINFDPQFAEDRFVVSVPEGWEVIDETGGHSDPPEQTP